MPPISSIARPASVPHRRFVGRERELALLAAELDSAAGGAGRIVVVRGEPGLGKTWLVREALAQCRDEVPTRWSRCSEAVGVPAYWTWHPLLGRPLGEAQEDALARLEPFERLRAHARAVYDACSQEPLRFVIDDLQWADVESLQLLDHLAHWIADWPLIVIATVRTGSTRDVVTQGVEALIARHEVRRIDLGGWSRDEVQRHLANTGLLAPPSDADTWHRATGGNPYFVDELARAQHTLSENYVPLERATTPLPSAIQRLIEQRVDACDPATRSLIELAAVIGRDFSLPLVHRLAEATLGEPGFGVNALDRALAARLLEPADDPTQLRFVHALVPRAVLSRIPARRLAAFHGHLGALLAQEPALRATGTAEVAGHLVDAARALPDYAEQAVHFSKWAGWEASTEQSHALAAGHFRDAVDLLALVSQPPARAALDRAELLISLGHSLALGSPEDADRAFEAAESLAHALLDSPSRDHAARVLALAVVVRTQEWCPATPESCRREVARAEAALAALGEGASVLRAQLLAALSPLLAFEPDRTRPVAFARQAFDVARETGDPLAQGRALEALHWSLLGEPAAKERLEVASRALLESKLAGSDRLGVDARCWRYFDLLELGRVEDAEAEIEEIEQIAGSLGEPRRRYQALTLRMGLALHRGRLAQAVDLAHEMLELGDRAAIPERHVVHEAVMTRVAFERDDAARVSNRDSLASGLRSQHLFQGSNPVVLSWQGRVRSATDDLRLLQTRGFDEIPHGPDRLATLYTLAWASIYLGDREAARELYDLLEPHAKRTVIFYVAALTGSVPRVMANLALLLGRHEDAQAHFHEAFRALERSDARCEWCHLHLERAQLRMATGARPEDPEVLDDLQRALALAREVGSLRVENHIRDAHPHLFADADAAPRTGRFERHDEGWIVGLGGMAIEVPDSRGLHFIAELLSRPGEEVLASTLVAEVTGELDVPLERARLRVTQRVRTSLNRLREADANLASHLANHVRTGNYCAYLPRPESRIAWRLAT